MPAGQRLSSSRRELPKMAFPSAAVGNRGRGQNDGTGDINGATVLDLNCADRDTDRLDHFRRPLTTVTVADAKTAPLCSPPAGPGRPSAFTGQVAQETQ
jgi:hypothetical protein